MKTLFLALCFLSAAAFAARAGLIFGGRLAAASDVSRVAWVSEQNLGDYRLTDGTLSVVQRAFAKLQP